MRQIVLYTRLGCRLCDDVKRRLDFVASELRFSINEINIEDDPELRVRYGHDIPVVMVGEEEAFRHNFDDVRLRQLLGAN